MRIGLVGLGRIGSFHARTLLALDAVTDLVVTDVVPWITAGIAAELGVVISDSPEDLLTAGLDGVVIASSTSTHPQLLLAFVEAGILTFCEKPVAANLSEVLAVRDKATAHDVAVQIGFPRRFDPDIVRARNDLRPGRLGTLHTLRSTTLDPAPPPAAYVADSGGIFRDCAIHDFDTVRWVTGREVVEVYSVGSNHIVDYVAAAQDADTATSVLTLDDGAIAVVSNARRNGRGHDVRLELLGTDDSVAAGLGRHTPAPVREPRAWHRRRPRHPLRWVQRFTPLLIDAARPVRHLASDRWFVDEIYVKVCGVWSYVYRAVDQHGQVIDVYVSRRRDIASARTFFSTALAVHGDPAEVITDRAPALAK